MEVLSRIREIMEKKSLTPYKLAELSHLSRSTLSNMFKKTTCPTISTLEKICNGLNISMSEFFSDGSKCDDLSLEQKQVLETWDNLTDREKKAFLLLFTEKDPI